jgi:hypothetical protein
MFLQHVPIKTKEYAKSMTLVNKTVFFFILIVFIVHVI